jgi:hypothetical protein
VWRCLSWFWKRYLDQSYSPLLPISTRTNLLKNSRPVLLFVSPPTIVFACIDFNTPICIISNLFYKKKQYFRPKFTPPLGKLQSSHQRRAVEDNRADRRLFQNREGKSKSHPWHYGPVLCSEWTMSKCIVVVGNPRNRKIPRSRPAS